MNKTISPQQLDPIIRAVTDAMVANDNNVVPAKAWQILNMTEYVRTVVRAELPDVLTNAEEALGAKLEKKEPVTGADILNFKRIVDELVGSAA